MNTCVGGWVGVGAGGGGGHRLSVGAAPRWAAAVSTSAEGARQAAQRAGQPPVLASLAAPRAARATERTLLSGVITASAVLLARSRAPFMTVASSLVSAPTAARQAAGLRPSHASDGQRRAPEQDATVCCGRGSWRFPPAGQLPMLEWQQPGRSGSSQDWRDSPAPVQVLPTVAPTPERERALVCVSPPPPPTHTHHHHLPPCPPEPSCCGSACSEMRALSSCLRNSTLSSPSSASRALPRGQDTGAVTTMMARTSQEQYAPISRPYRLHTACAAGATRTGGTGGARFSTLISQ
jgi:hypothetical protein